MAAAAAVMAGLRKLPREAVPETLEILMQATGVDSVTLLGGLLRSVPPEIKEDLEEMDSKAETDTEIDLQKLIAYVAAVVHLLKSSAHDNAMDQVVWTVFIPLLRNKNPKLGLLQTEVIDMMAEAVGELGAWSYMVTTLARACQDALVPAASPPLSGIQELAWSRLQKRSPFVSNACQLVAVLLTSAMESTRDGNAASRVASNRATTSSAERFCKEVVCMFMEPALAFLSEPQQTSLRQHAMFTLLPPIMKAISRFDLAPTCPQELEVPEARFSASQKIWECCKRLFNHCPLQRHDAYMALAVFAKQLLPPVHFTNELLLLQRTPQKFGFDRFDVRDDPLFWNELKAGLVHDDPLTRKRALFVLKRALPNPRGEAVSSNSSGHGDVYEHGEGTHQRNIRRERWSSFVLLYETLEEYRTHLVESAWTHEMSFLLPFSKPRSGELRPWANPGIRSNTEGVDVDFKWISVLFHRGFDHKNPQVRQMVLRSFLELEWAHAPKVKAFVPEEFVLGPFLCAMDDPVHHQDLGLKGCYSSYSAAMAAKFICSYSASLYSRNRAGFVQRLAKALVARAPCWSGLMALTICLEAAAVGPFVIKPESSNANKPPSSSSPRFGDEAQSDLGNNPTNMNENGDVLENLQLVVEDSKRHHNHSYRAKVCGHVLAAAAALTGVPYVPVNKLAQFISSFPRDLLAQGGLLHDSLLKWLHPSQTAHGGLSSTFNSHKWLREGLKAMMEEYLKWKKPTTEVLITQDELQLWEREAQKWTRLLAIGVVNTRSQQKLVLLVERCSAEIYQRAYMVPCVAEKVLLLLQCLLKECRPSAYMENPAHSIHGSSTKSSDIEELSSSRLARFVANSVLNTLDELAQYAKRSAGVFWEYYGSNLRVPLSTETEKLEGTDHVQRPSAIASAVLQGVLAVKTLAESCIWYCQVKSAAEIPEVVINFFWYFAWQVVTTTPAKNETGAEVQLGAYEALGTVCSALAATVSPFVVSTAAAQVGNRDSMFALTSASMVDELVTALRSNVEAVLHRGALAKRRHKVLVHYKWGGLEHLLSIPKSAVARPKEDAREMPNQLGSALSNSVLQVILQDAIDSLESAGEEYLLPLLHSIRWLMYWGVLLPVDSSDEAQEKTVQIMWSLVQSGWATMADCKRTKVAPFSAFLSAILHPTAFSDKEMHEAGVHDDDGPLKWLICRLIEKGATSPRTMRLSAIHMTALWLQFPTTLAYYGDQLKMLSLHGGEVVHEDLNGDSREMQEDAVEYMTLKGGCDTEITETFLDSEIYIRVTVAVMFHLVAQVVEAAEHSQDSYKVAAAKPGADCGRKLLIEMLTCVVEDPELSKEQYKSRGPTHRRKVRAWQMLCILSPFVSSNEIDQVTSLLEIALERDNLPFVRHYIETFAVQLFLRFPDLVEKHLIPVLHDYSLKTQALSSYVLIATNVVLCNSSATLQADLLRQVLPAILPFMTAHRQSITTFTQVLIYQVLQRWITGCGPVSSSSGLPSSMNPDHFSFSLDRICLQSLAACVEGNAGCMRMKSAVERYLNNFDPMLATTPRGVFCKQGWVDTNETVYDVSFECVPVAVLDQISYFLNVAREESSESFSRESLDMNAKLSTDDSSTTISQYSDKEAPGGSAPKHLDLDLQSATPVEILPPSEYSMKDSAGSLDSPPSASSLGPPIQKLRLYDDVIRHGQKHLEDGSTIQRDHKHFVTHCPYDAEEDFLLDILESKGHRSDHIRGARQELIVVATLQADNAGLAGFARTCEVFEIAKLVVTSDKDKEAQQNNVTPKRSVPPMEVSEASLENYLQRKRKQGFSLLGLEKAANSVNVANYSFPKKSVLILGRGEGIPLEIVHMLDACLEVPNLEGIRPLDVYVGASIAVWEYTRQHRLQSPPPSDRNHGADNAG